MSQSYIPIYVRQAVEEIAHNRCEYCQTQALLIGMPLEIDHIVPEVEGGETIFENLALACSHCNQHKGSRTATLDPQTNELTRFFTHGTTNGQTIFAGQLTKLILKE